MSLLNTHPSNLNSLNCSIFSFSCSHLPSFCTYFHITFTIYFICFLLSATIIKSSANTKDLIFIFPTIPLLCKPLMSLKKAARKAKPSGYLFMLQKFSLIPFLTFPEFIASSKSSSKCVHLFPIPSNN